MGRHVNKKKETKMGKKKKKKEKGKKKKKAPIKHLPPN